jgi:hypothetical protein
MPKNKTGHRTARTTLNRKKRFLQMYEKLGNATATAEATGISRYTHIEWLKRSESYRKAFELADDAATEMLEKEAIRRAVEGREEDVYYNGQKVGTVKKYSDVLLIFLLKSKRPDVYRERYDARLTANLNVQSAVKVIHEYHEQPPAIDVSLTEQLPNKALMSATPGEATLSQPSTVQGYLEPAVPNTRLLYRTVAEADNEGVNFPTASAPVQPITDHVAASTTAPDSLSLSLQPSSGTPDTSSD